MIPHPRRVARFVLPVLAGAALLPAAALAVAFERTRRQLQASLEEAERSGREFRRAVGRLGEALAATHDRRRILGVVLETARAILGAEEALFLALDPATRRLVAREASSSSSGDPPTGWSIPVGAGLAGAVAHARRSARHPGGDTAFARPPLAPEPDRATGIAVPFFSQGDLFGVVGVYGRRDGEWFQGEDLETLATLVRQAETAIDNAFLHEEAQRLSITDGLTGLWNRRELELRCQQEIDRAARFGRPMGMIMCDIDRFKAVNDSWGHIGGDAVLIELARRLSTATREIDVVARYGGEEFALVLPETNLEGGYVLADKIRSAVSGTPVEHEGALRTVTVSLGVAAYPGHGKSLRELLMSADAALYRAKQAGRDQVCVAGDPEGRGLA